MVSWYSFGGDSGPLHSPVPPVVEVAVVEAAVVEVAVVEAAVVEVIVVEVIVVEAAVVEAAVVEVIVVEVIVVEVVVLEVDAAGPEVPVSAPLVSVVAPPAPCVPVLLDMPVLAPTPEVTLEVTWVELGQAASPTPHSGS